MDSAVSALLGGEEVLGPSSSNLALALATREGLPIRAAIQLANEILRVAAALPASDVDRIFVGMVPVPAQMELFGAAMGPLGAIVGSLIGEMHRSQIRTRLTSTESDVVVRTATALARGTEVLGDKKKAVHWLNSPNKALGGEVPMSLLDTSAGEYEVQSLLDRIEYGVYS